MPNDSQLFSPNQSLGCPVSGLSIITKPEWTKIRLDSDFFVTFSIIGKAILLATLNGKSSDEGTKKLIKKIREVIIEADLSGRNYVELRDYSMLRGTPSKAGRMAVINYLLKEGTEGHLLGVWVYGAPLVIGLMIQAGLSLYKFAIPCGVAKDYREAVRNALKVLRQSGVDVGSKLYPRLKKNEWALDIEEYGISFELIGDDILYTVASGRLKELHVKKIFELHEKVLSETGLTQKGYYYRIINLERFESITWKARLMYMKGLKELNEKTPCRLLMFFGLNNFMKSLIAINRPFASFPVMVAKDFQDALEVTEREREILAESARKSQKPKAKIYTEEQLKGFGKEILRVIGGINWDQAGISLDGISDEHPLKPVMDALALVKLDLDNMLQEKNKSQESLQESEGKYRNILESIEDGYFEVDLAGNFTFFNLSLCNILGYPSKEILGMNNRAFMDRENAKKVFRAFNEIYVTGIPSKGFEWDIIQKDGARRHLEVSISLIVSPEGKPTGFRGVLRDVSERKNIELEIQKHREHLEEMITARTNELAEAMRKAEFANKSKGQFLANMSHEIRTPINGIMGMVELCLQTELNADQTHIVSTINKEADSLLGIINQILDFSKIEAGKLEIEQIPFDLKNLFEDLTESFSYRTINKRLELISFISPETPTLIVGDPGRLRQVLKNLIGNAFKFTHEGRIYIKAEPTQDMGDKIKLRFLVKDTGIGIPKEKQAIVFESFTQADGSTTRKYGGTGLGTTISKQLAELMGGEIGVDSEEGKGATFWFTVVFSKQGETDLHRKKEVPLSDVRMLVVDDNKTSRQTIVEYVRTWGSIPVEAASAKEALSILKESIADGEQVNLVLSDLNVPEINGFDLAREIRSVESYNSVPIIVITAFGNAGDGKTCRDIGIEGYLTKPISEKELRRSIESVLVSSMSGESVRAIGLVTRHSIAEEDKKEIRILLAEDYPTNQVIAKRHLEHAGYQVDLAEDGMQAVDAFKRKHYELILMDVQMPAMDGCQATKAIRELESEFAAMENMNANETLQRVPIIAMTAHAMRENKEICIEAGMDDFLSKPFTREELLPMVSKWLKASAKPASRRPSAPLNPNSETGQDISQIEVYADDPIDIEKAIEEFEGDKQFLSEVIDGFTKEVSEQIGTIRKALSCGDAETVRKEAHAIKGGAANLIAKALSRVAFELEIKGKSNELDGAGEIVDGLDREFAVLKCYVQENFL